MNTQPVYMVKIPNNYIDYQADASFSDTLAADDEGRIYQKWKDQDANVAWLNAVKAILSASHRQTHFTKVALLESELRAVISDMHYFATLPLGDYDPLDRPRMRRHAKQCADSIVKFESLIELKQWIATSNVVSWASTKNDVTISGISDTTLLRQLDGRI